MSAPEPMSDERLAQIDRSLDRGPLTRAESLDLMAEAKRARAALAARPERRPSSYPQTIENAAARAATQFDRSARAAARPEPIGYVVAEDESRDVYGEGIIDLTEAAQLSAALNFAQINPTWQVCALVPVEVES